MKERNDLNSEPKITLSVDEMLGKWQESKERYARLSILARLWYRLRAQISFMDLHLPLLNPIILFFTISFVGLTMIPILFTEQQGSYWITRGIIAIGVWVSLSYGERNFKFRKQWKNLFRDIDISELNKTLKKIKTQEDQEAHQN